MWDASWDALLGQGTDEDVAERIRLRGGSASPAVVRRHRLSLGIAPGGGARDRWSDEDRAAVAALPYGDCAAWAVEHGRTVAAVRSMRAMMRRAAALGGAP